MTNRDRLVSTFLELVQIDSPSGHEEEIARHLTAELKSLGLTVERDTTGNVIGRLARFAMAFTPSTQTTTPSSLATLTT